MSNAEDLVKLGNAVLACLQGDRDDGLGTPAEQPAALTEGPSLLLRPKTVDTMWTPIVSMGMGDFPKYQYGLGWFVVSHQEGMLCGKETPFSAGHGGGAVGATSALVVLPSRGGKAERKGGRCDQPPPPRGVVVAVIFNLQGVKHVYKLGLKIAEEFNY